MSNFKFSIDEDEFDEALVKQLQWHYEDQVTNWKHEPDAANLQDSLLTVIEFYMIPDEFEAWYETVKEL